MADLYLGQLNPWRDMLKLGLTTWAEQPEPTRSDCHAWSASPNYDLLTVVAGIQPGSPGFRSVRIEPHLGTLHELDASMPHAGGDIHTVYKRDGAQWKATVTLPQGTLGRTRLEGARLSSSLRRTDRVAAVSEAYSVRSTCMGSHRGCAPSGQDSRPAGPLPAGRLRRSRRRRSPWRLTPKSMLRMARPMK